MRTQRLDTVVIGGGVGGVGADAQYLVEQIAAREVAAEPARV
jgi:cation diffusion facilitator CzcD-associated flavoprotein CzcO